jgi:hypothetical protein
MDQKISNVELATGADWDASSVVFIPRRDRGVVVAGPKGFRFYLHDPMVDGGPKSLRAYADVLEALAKEVA